MKKVTATDGPLTVHSGQVQLTAAQAAVRAHALKPVGKPGRDGAGVYQVTGAIQFKRGESFGFDGVIGKGGELRDPEAEALARLDAEARIRAELRAELEPRYQAALREALEEQETRLRAELGPK